MCDNGKRVVIGPLRVVFKCLFSYFNLNMNEWVPVKGRAEVVPSNSVFTSNWYQSGIKA